MKFQTLLAQLEVPNGKSKSDLTDFPQVTADESQLQNILALVFAIAAALAVISILIASISLVTGGDNPETVSRARKTIIFSLVGLAIAVSAEAITLTVLGSL